MNTELYAKLLSEGLDEETARKIAENSGGEEKGQGLPFDVIKINYDKEDILSDIGVKKGEIITGYQIDKKNFSVTKEGKVFKQPMDFVVVAIGYQYSSYDTNTKGYKHITPIFSSIYDAKKVKDLKTGKTVGELKDAGESLKFNCILLTLVKENKEWQPYIIYLRGTNYAKFNEQLEDNDLSLGNIALNKVFSVSTKKVATEAGLPAWIYVIDKVAPFTDFIKAKDNIVEAINKFDEWKKSFNNNADSNVATGGEAAPAQVDDDIDTDVPM